MTSEREQEVLNNLTAWNLSLRDGAFIHQHVVDAWAAQHADEDSKPIRVAFALVGLYLHIEKGFTGRQVQLAHMQLAQPHGRGRPRKKWPQFPLPKKRGSITVVDVMAAEEDGRADAIDRWCASVWEAWRESHDRVRRWADNEEVLDGTGAPILS